MCEVALPRAAKMATQTMEQLRAVAMDRGESASTPARRSLLAIDSYIEQGAWSLDQCAQLYRAAHATGLRTRCHADQFTSQGMVQASIAAAHGDTNTLPAPLHTLDHLEATDAQTLAQLAHTSTIPVLLPCTGFHTDQRFTNARALVDAGGTAALATNYNPGSSPCFAMPMAIALAVRCNKLSIAEAVYGATVNAAAALGLQDRGCIWPGQRADLVLLHAKDVRSLAYEFGGNPVALAIAAGRGAENHECMKDVRS
jgi:imidazolonepropionase